MKAVFKGKRVRKLFLFAGTAAVLAIFAACAPSTGSGTSGSGASSSGSGTTSGAAVKPPTPAANSNGVVTATSWQTAYPHEYATYANNAKNSTTGAAPFSARGNMIEMYPQIKVIWAGNGFSKSYFEPNGHQYALEDIGASGRPNEKTLANCLTCKSADFTALYQAQGDSIFSQPFAQLKEQLSEPISCYNCHENDPETLAVTSKFFKDALGSDTSTIPMSSQVCGQCHNEYYFNADTKAVTNPYKGTAQMTPEAIYAYYGAMGFKDATNEATGVDWIKVQHPEFEFVYGGTGSYMSQRINSATGERYSCADCHMGNELTASDGTTYRSHLLVSPLENPELLKSSCNLSGCHTDLAAQVKAWQKESEDKVQKVADQLVVLNEKLAAQKDGLAADKLAQVKELYREAQFYWEFVMVENSEGAHNPKLSNSCLDKAKTNIEQALALLS